MKVEVRYTQICDAEIEIPDNWITKDEDDIFINEETIYAWDIDAFVAEKLALDPFQITVTSITDEKNNFCLYENY